MCKTVRDEFYKLYQTLYIDFYLWEEAFLISKCVFNKSLYNMFEQINIP